MRTAVIVAGLLLVVAMLAYWLATGAVPQRKPPAWLTAQPIAHRGYWTDGPERPENSLAAFDAAATNGFAVELDIQLSSDGKVVVFHDDDLERMTGTPGSIAEEPLSRLRTLRLRGGDETIPTLSEVLGLVGGRVPLFIEIKNSGRVGPLEEAVAGELETYDGQAAIISFNPFALSRIASMAPEVPRGQVAGALREEDLAFYEKFVLRYLLINWISKPDFIDYDIRELPSTTTRLQRWRGRPLIGWTAENVAQLEAAERICDAVTCNPDALSEH